jgi:hypothetical protein
VFGPEITAQCTPLGTKTKKMLLQTELYHIKVAIFQFILGTILSHRNLKMYGIYATLPYNRDAGGILSHRNLKMCGKYATPPYNRDAGGILSHRNLKMCEKYATLPYNRDVGGIGQC